MRAAVVGCGRMGAFSSEKVRRFAPPPWFPLAHAEAIAAHPQLELAALCDADPEALARAAQVYGVGTTYTDYSALADAVRPALVGIATRTIGRSDVIRCFFEAGTRAVHVEKPLCNSVEELKAIEALLASGSRYMTYGTIRRHFAIYRDAVSLVRSGRFGDLKELRVSFGGAALYWGHPHGIDLILFGAGEGRRVAGVQAVLAPLERDEAGVVINDPEVRSATIWFDDGVAGHIGRAPGMSFSLGCENGEVTVASDGRETRIVEASDDDPYPELRVVGAKPEEPDAATGTLGPIAQLVGCLKGDAEAIRANAALRADILTGQRVAFAMVQSSLEGGRVVRLDEIDPSMRILGKTGANFA
ncbi:MAG: Gfo/Idh/MocA family oxidoreductase [Sphingomonas sp.]|uniref:Gfo/Idh/MocA family protein n=1 Tax=Sphingomonas sp. TaxID=28214 RepID=UPI002274C6B2|nr:Gfo/Idh/MocA family oxidoreductase [Sphingomonas sp.]MCX8477972.1 Gfo/Idh/MocA family oxidoreductase [Sphingomonas sp.]